MIITEGMWKEVISVDLREVREFIIDTSKYILTIDFSIRVQTYTFVKNLHTECLEDKYDGRNLS